MAEIIIADKPTLDAVNGKADAIHEDIGELKSSVETANQASNTIKTSVDKVNDNLTEARASNLENLDVPVSTRAEQKTLETLLEDVLTLKTSVEDLSANRGGGSGTTVSKTSALHYAQSEIREDRVLLTINGTGRLRTITFKVNYLDSLAASVMPYTLTVHYNPMGEIYADATGNDAPTTTNIALTVSAATLPVLGGTASISGTNEIGQTLTADTSFVTGGSGAFSYQWQADGINIGTDSDTYSLTGAEAGKAITCVITRADATGSVSATFESGNTVPYDVTITRSGDSGTDDAALSQATGRAGDSITLNYTLENSDTNNTLTFTGATGLAPVISAGTGTLAYTVTAGDAVNGVITITATFLHTDLAIRTLSFADSGPVTKVYGSGNFTNAATPSAGDGAITYSSSFQTVATVDDSGAVIIVGVGQSAITASVAADGTYAAAIASYTLTVNNASQTAPDGVDKTDETAVGANDGTITGVTAAMEYKLSTDALYTTITGTTVTGLAPGTYLVRYKTEPNYDASPDVTVTISAYVSTTVPVSSITVTGAGGATTIATNGGTLQMLADVQPSDATIQSVTWSVTNGTGGATISGSGLLTATANGTVTVRATAVDSSGVFGDIVITISGQGITPPTTYFVTVNGSYAATTGAGSYAPSATVTINAGSRSNYAFIGWTTSSTGVTFANSNSATTTFTMPANIVTVTANWTYTGGNGGGSGGGGSGGGGSGGGGSDAPPVVYPVIVTAKPNFPNTARLTLSQSPDKNNALAFTITKEMVQQALDKAKEKAKADGSEDYGYALVFYFSATATINNLNITFNADALTLLESAGVKETSVITDAFRFGFDLAAIKQLNSQSGGRAVTVSASRFNKLSDAAKAYIGSRPAWDVTINFKKDGKTEYISNLGKGFISMGMKYTPASSEKNGNLAVVYVPGTGKPQILTNSSYDNGWMIWQRSSLSVYGVGYITPAPAFTDTTSHWAKDNIDFVASRGLVSGTSATAFSPDTAITRADFLMALSKLAGSDVSDYTNSSFTDVANTSPAMPYIEWAVKNKIVQGIGNNQFGPDNKITRQDMAVMMGNYAKATGYTLPVSRQAVTFADDAKISAYAKDAVKVIQQTGVMSGKPNNLFDPQGSATRAEAATILCRFVEYVIDEGTARGWVQNDAGQWQYINTYGKAVTSNWLTAGENKYYFDDKGIMVSGKWLQIEGKWHYFDSDGKLAMNTIIDGYTVGADGARR